MSVANLCRHRDPCGWRLDRNPVHAGGDERRPFQSGSRTDGHVTGLGIDPAHVHGNTSRYAQPLPLPDIESVNTGMAAEDAPVLIPDCARLDGCGSIPLNELGVVARGHEANFLTVGLAGDLQSKSTRLGAHLIL